MVHNEHNKPKRSSSLLLIIFGAILFMVGPTLFHQNSPELGILALVSGFILGGIGFYLKYVRGKIVR
tara:strand:+ start:24 stop:224 length:201 start_codon:yes stop_codon:yes gene_type:complete